MLASCHCFANCIFLAICTSVGRTDVLACFFIYFLVDKRPGARFISNRRIFYAAQIRSHFFQTVLFFIVETYRVSNSSVTKLSVRSVVGFCHNGVLEQSINWYTNITPARTRGCGWRMIRRWCLESHTIFWIRIPSNRNLKNVELFAEPFGI